uniref:Plasma membrane ATPase n=1 Tax=Dunaliella maritima TaxID=289300 RepID=A0A1Q1N6W5_9CHLO|nr:P-type ATPase HA2 [Dunaliella maritima]
MGLTIEPPHDHGLTTQEVEQLQKEWGLNHVAAKTIPEWKKILDRYLDWVSLIILISAIISAAVPVNGDQGWTSFVMLILELQFVVWMGYYSDRNAGDAVAELAALSAPMCHCLRNGKWGSLPVKELVPGDIIGLKGGDVIPADSKLIGEGEPLKIDESSLTGECLAVTRHPGQEILAGAVVVSGELDAMVTATGVNSFFGKTMALLAVPPERGHLQQVLNRVSIALALFAVAGCAIILGVLTGHYDNPPGYSIVTVFVIFTSVVPIGMPVVTTTVLAVGAREMAREKAIVTRLSALEEMSGMEVLASDKTGTLTLNQLSLDKEDILNWGTHTKDDVLLYSCLSAKWENNDAIDKAVTNSLGDKKYVAGYRITKFSPFNPVDKKTTAHTITPTGEKLITTKGAPQIIGDMLADPAARQACADYIAERASRGLRSLGVARSDDDGQTWSLVGLISLLDPPRPDSGETIKLAQSMGVAVKMVTGDQFAIAVETCKRLGMGSTIMEGKTVMAGLKGGDEGKPDPVLIQHCDESDGFAGVYPEHKHMIVSALQAKGRLVGMTGDGVNDAPALKKANVGIAVAGATSAAKGAADIILTREGISTIIIAIVRSRKIFRRLEMYIIYRMASSVLILGFFFFAILIFDFEIPTWILVLISMLNDASVIATSYDAVHSSDYPLHWNMTKDLAIAFSIAMVGIVGNVLLVPFVRPDLWFEWPELDTEPALKTPPDNGVSTSGKEPALIFLSLSGMVQLNIILTRNPSFWWHFSKKSAPKPSPILLVPVTCFLGGSTFMSVYWNGNIKPDGQRYLFEGAGWHAVLLVWAYVFVFWVIADFFKVAISSVFVKADLIKDELKGHIDGKEKTPGWVKALDWPGETADKISDKIEACFDGMCSCFEKKEKKAKFQRTSVVSEKEGEGQVHVQVEGEKQA